MNIDDARAALDAALEILPCDCIPAYKDRGLAAPDCPRCQWLDDVRAAVWPIIGGLEEEMAQERFYRVEVQEQLDAAKAQWKVDLDRAQAATTVANDTVAKLEAKLAAAEADLEHITSGYPCEECGAGVILGCYGCLLKKAEDKLAQAEALLQRRPHLREVVKDGMTFLFHQHQLQNHDVGECARLGGACAK